MNLYHLKWKKESLPAVLLGAAAVFAVLIVIKATSIFEASARAQSLVKMAVARDELSSERAGGAAVASKAIAEELKKRNLFSPPQPPRHPVTSVLGILGDEALIGDRWYKAGDTIGDARIVAIEPTQVRIRWQGRETVFTPMEVTDQPDAGGVNLVRLDFGQAEQVQASGQENRMPVSDKRVERSRTAKIVKVPESDRSMAGAKQKSLTEKKQYQKMQKQDVKVPKKKNSAGNRTNSDAISRKKATAADARKSGRKSSR